MLESFSHSTSHFFFFFYVSREIISLILVPIICQKNYKVAYLLRRLIFSSKETCNNNVQVVDNLNCSSWTQRSSFSIMRRYTREERENKGKTASIRGSWRHSFHGTTRTGIVSETNRLLWKGKRPTCVRPYDFPHGNFQLSRNDSFLLSSRIVVTFKSAKIRCVYGQSSTITLILHTQLLRLLYFTLCVT